MASNGSEQVHKVVARDPDALIQWAGAHGDPGHDQHFFVSDHVIDRIPTYLPEEADRSRVLGIGGGSGILANRLLDMTDRVTVVEQDRTFAAHLRREFTDEIKSDWLTVVEDDAFDVDLPELTACVSNLPYGIPSKIPSCLLPRGKPLVLMLQEEFGERIAAEAGTSRYGRLSVNTQHYNGVELCEHVPREAFNPKPAVQDAIARITPHEPEYEVGDETFFLDFMKALFTQRRETIRNGIRNTVHISGLSDPEVVVKAAGEDVLQKHVGNMVPAELAELT